MPPTDLPSPFDVDQLRRQAKELRASALAGDLLARERIRRTHPRFGRTRLADDDLVAFTLRDAQLCVARELGFDGWTSVLAHAQGEPADRPWRRWPGEPSGGLYRRASDVARITGDSYVGPEHALGALVRPPTSSVAAEVLAEFGVTWERWLERHPEPEEQGDSKHLVFNPNWHGFVGFAQGLALAAGADTIHDEHALLTMIYRRTTALGNQLDWHDVDPDAIALALARRGIAASDLRPPASMRKIEGMGPRIYYEISDDRAVSRALEELYDTEATWWGFNIDEEDGRRYVIGESHLDIERTVRAVVADPSTVVVVPLDEIRKRRRNRR